jgi:DNA polymerase-3 subunit beta
VRIALKGDMASFAAADSFRLAFRDITLDEPVATAQEVVIPARTLSTLGKTLVGVERDVEMLIAPSGKQVMFRANGLHLVSRAIDGTYPNIGKYQALAPATVLEIDTKELSKAVELAAYFAASSSNVIRLTLTPEADGKGTLTLSANAAEVGDNRSEHDVTIRGTGGRVALNVQFLADGIAAIGTPTVAIYVDSEVEPVVLRGVGGESYAYVAMPMTVK